MSDKVKYLPGVNPEEQEEITFAAVLKDLEGKPITRGMVIAVMENGDFFITGNTSIASSVYWLEVAKKVIINEST